MIKKLTLLPASIVLASCTVVTATAPVSAEFESNADKITLEAPVWRATDSGFNMPIGNYRCDNADVSWSHASKDLVGEQALGRTYYDWMNSDRTWRIVQTYNVDRSQNYGFDLLNGSRLVSQTKCAIFSRSKENKYIESDSEQRPLEGQERRRETFLACVINHQSSKWELTLAVDVYGKMSAALRSESGEFTLEELGNTVFLDESGKQLEIPNTMQENKSGLKFLQGSEQVAAVSFAGNSTFWVRKNQSAATDELLYSANFALTMFNWIDAEWRQ